MNAHIRLNYFYEIADIIASSFISYLPDDMEMEDVIQILVMDLYGKLQANKFSTDDEAWVICQHRLFDMFREWEAERKRTGKAREEEHEWQNAKGIGDTLNRLYEQDSVAVPVRVTGKEIVKAIHNYGKYLKDLKNRGYSALTKEQTRSGFLFVGRVVHPVFLAGLTKALIVLGTTPVMAVKVISVGLKYICNGCKKTDEDSRVLRNFRYRIGRGIRWQRLPGGDVILRRGRFRLRVDRT